MRLGTWNLELGTLNYFSYFSEIEELFVRRRGKNLLLSPLDWALIESWKERNVPLHVVLRGIETVFDAADAQPQARKRNIKSLLYCRDEIEIQFAAWQESSIGNQSKTEKENKEQSIEDKERINPFSPDDIFRHLRNVKAHFQAPRANLNGSWQSISTRILQRLQMAENDFRANGDAEQLEDVLSKIDREIDETLPKIFSPTKIAEIEKGTLAQLRTYKDQMTTEVFTQTFHALLIKNLREQTELPRLSLFYL